MAVVKRDYHDLTTGADPLGEWNSYGLGTRSDEELGDKCSYYRSLDLVDTRNFLLETVLSTDDTNAPAVRLWARFKKDDGVGAYSMDSYSVEVRLLPGTPRKLVLWDTFAQAQVGAALNCPAAGDWADATRKLRVRLRLVSGTLYMEAEPAFDSGGTSPQWESALETVSKSVVVASGLTAGDGSHWELGFGNARDVSITGHTSWWDVHTMTLDDMGMDLPHPPAPVQDDSLAEAGAFAMAQTKNADPTVHNDDGVIVQCQFLNGGSPYLDGDTAELRLDCPSGTEPAPHPYGSAILNGSHTFSGLTDYQTVTLHVAITDGVCGRVVETTADLWLERHIGVRAVPGGTQTLPVGRERLRYQTLIEFVVEDVDTGDALAFEFSDGGTNTELVSSSDPADTATIRTIVAPTDVQHLPANSSEDAQTYTIGVQVTRTRASLQPDGGNWVNLTLEVANTRENLDVAVLMDRSGSMRNDRWLAACNGAQMFTTLVNQANTEAGGDHRAGVYWFWGDNSSGPDNYANLGGYHGGQGYYGTFPPDPATVDDDKLTIETNRAVELSIPDTDPPPVFGICHPEDPDHYTALGAGLLHCRDELVARSVDTDSDGNPRDRMIVLLSDGMENRKPTLDNVFYSPPVAHPEWDWRYFDEPGGTGPYVHEPLIKLFSAAVDTGPSWVTALRGLSDHLGGDGALDVKPIANGETNGIAIQNWFDEVFTGLFGFTYLVAPADPTLARGQTKTQPVNVVLGQDVVIFYLLQAKADPQDWEFSVRLPNTTFELDRSNADDYACVDFVECGMHKMLIVRPDLDIPGHEHRWAGTWEMKVKRTGTTQGNYALGAMAHQDFTAHVDVLTPPRPRPGDTARLRVTLADRNGKRLPDARVTTRIGQPGPWAGDFLARRMSRNLKLVKQLYQAKGKVDRDLSDVADRYLRRLIDKGQLPAGKSYNRSVPQTAPGIYELEIPLKAPGTYELDTSIDGVRRFPRTLVDKLLKPHRRRLRRLVPQPKRLAQELRYLDRRASTRQSFHLETRNVVGVQLVTSLRHTPTEGYFNDKRVIRLELTPTDKKKRLLGPGWAGDIQFQGPAGLKGSWPAVDGANGAYWVDIPVKARGLRFDVARRALVADRLELRHPELGLIRPDRDELPLEGFAAMVLGVRVPILVQALLGNKNTCEVHLATCKHVKKVKPIHRVPFHDLEAASDAGFDSCEVCLPLICNMSPRHMEAHKPFCGFVPLIKPKNRLEVTSWRAAKKLGFDGCASCLPDHHTRRKKKGPR